MRTHAIMLSVLMLLARSTETAAADAREDAAELDRMIARIEQMLPVGWTLAFEVEKGTSRPKLVISSTEELPVEFMGPGKSGNSAVDTANRKVTIDLTFVPYMTTDDRAQADKRNEELEKQRRQYEESRLKQRQSSYKGGFTPASYQRQTGDESPIIREYALFWLDTEPQPLPSHHCGRFSVHTYDLDPVTNPMKIHNERRAEEFERIVDGLKAMFVAYEREVD